MTAPAMADVTGVLDRYRTSLREVTDSELERRAATVAALPGRIGDELRRMVDAERESRRPARAGRSGVLRVAAAAAVAVGAPAAVLSGRALASYADVVPQQELLAASGATVGLVGLYLAGRWVVRWVDEHRHPLAVVVDEADLDPYGQMLLARVRVERRARGEVA
jgi:hypothetical protein